tara:strand:- start:593 stop:955 length:363 start_codon:yes stop_codon:yes gene_type:complete
MDTENIVRLGQDLETLLPFGIEGIISKKQYEQITELIDQLTNDRNWALHEVRLCHPSYTTSQAYIGLYNTLIVKSVYELIFANLLTYAKIEFDYNVDSGIQKKTKITLSISKYFLVSNRF